MSAYTSCRQRKSNRAVLLMAASILSLWASHPGAVRAGGPQKSPFAGRYGCSDYFDVRISQSGSIRGSLDLFTDVSGSISPAGYLEITTVTGVPDFDRTHGKPLRYVYIDNAIGIGALDDVGNLYGLLMWESGSTREFFWPRCP